MSKRHKLRARVRRRALLSLLGRSCVYCGATRRLEFDCVCPAGDRHHRMDTSARMSFYWAMHLRHNIAVACSSCNSRKADACPAGCPFLSVCGRGRPVFTPLLQFVPGFANPKPCK